MAWEAKTGTAIGLDFAAYDEVGAALTGVSSWTVKSYQNGADVSGSLSVAVAEIGSTGVYTATFTPATDGRFSITLQPSGYDDIYAVQANALAGDRGLLYKAQFHQLQIDYSTPGAVKLKLYAADGNTVIQQWELDTDAGENVQAMYGAQSKRGTPEL